MSGRRVVALLVLAAVAATAWSLYAGRVRIPDRYNPFAPLVIEEPPGFLTRLKLGRLADDAERCREVLGQSTFRFAAVPDRNAGPGCEIHDAVRIERTSVPVGAPFVLSCRAAVALALWDRHVLQPAAQAHLGQPVARMHHFGSFACRNVYGRENARRSRHATADALDVAGFTLADGRQLRVVGHWQGEGREAAFLRDVHRGACRFFDTVLGPDYNAAHRDHLHFDRGSYRVCR